jgi:hypothetical protein
MTNNQTIWDKRCGAIGNVLGYIFEVISKT